MLMALGAAAAAWDAVKSVASQASSSTQSTGFFSSGTDPFTMSGSDSSQPGSKKSGAGALSPATMQALLAAQGQFSMSALNGSGLSSTSLTPANAPSSTAISLDTSGTGAASYNATGMMLQRAQLMSAFA